MCLEDCGNKRTRREFLAASAALAGISLGSALFGQKKTGENDNILQEFVEFKNETDTIGSYLAYPKKKGKRPAVLVLHGNWGVSDDVRHTAVRLADAGYVGLAISPTSRENDDVSRISRDFAMSNRFILTLHFGRASRHRVS